MELYRGIDCFQTLPQEIIDQIFSKLDKLDWKNVLCTCKKWKSIGMRTFDPSQNNCRAFRICCEKGKIECVKALLRDPRVNPSVLENAALLKACENGQMEVIKVLFEDKRVGDYETAISRAVKKGHSEVVIEILQRHLVEPNLRDNFLLKQACKKGLLQVTQELINDPRVDLTVKDNMPIGYACENGHLEIVLLLLQDPRVNPATSDNFALEKAVKHNHVKVVKALIEDGRIDSLTQYSRLYRRALAWGVTDIAEELKKKIDSQKVPKSRAKTYQRKRQKGHHSLSKSANSNVIPQ